MAEGAGNAVKRMLHSGYIGEGEEVVNFERDLMAVLDADYVLTTNSGTSALHLAYHMAIGGCTDAEVISSPITCTATNIPILHNGAKIVWADVDPLTGNIDPGEIEKLIGEKTKAIVMVHWGGNPCQISQVNDIGRRYGIKVIEDAAHALGATYRDLPVGRHSDFVAFSFQAIKHVTTVDGGCLVCKSGSDRERGQLLRWYGIDRNLREGTDFRCEVDILEAGYKFHMNNVSATIGRENLKHLPWIVVRHRDNARFYDSAFSASPNITVAPENPEGLSAFWLYTIHVENRDEVMRGLLENGIGASKVHSRNDGHTIFAPFKRPLPNCQSFERTHLCIPVGWWVSAADREWVADAVIKLTNRPRRASVAAL